LKEKNTDRKKLEEDFSFLNDNLLRLILVFKSFTTSYKYRACLINITF
jgi:hypothetical protein